jgi:predicted transglutaminase-like cysteine proteinase
MKRRNIACAISIGLFGILGLAFASAAEAGTYLPTSAAAVPPAGFLGFCVKHLQDCIAKSQEPASIELTDARRRMLETVQSDVNASIEPRLDASHTWDYSTDGTGDCNKYALTKRRDLIAMGWPRNTLLLATATTERGEGHLVLVARTDRGDLVLDNRVAQVSDWSVLPYHWISVQSQQSPVRWLSILGQPITTADASAAVRQGSQEPREAPSVVTR